MIAAVIQARLGSERCKRKMTRNFAGTNLISLALEKFSQPTDAFTLYFAAHEPELITIGKNYDCTIIRRNEESARGDSIEVVMNYLPQIPEDNIMFINPCHPFLSLDTLENALQTFHMYLH